MPKKIFIYAIGAYIVPKAMQYLCRNPQNENNNLLDSCRRRFHHFHETFVNYLGNRNWSLFSDIVINNAWISVLFFPCIYKAELVANRYMNIASSSSITFIFNVLIWKIKNIAAKTISSIRNNNNDCSNRSSLVPRRDFRNLSYIHPVLEEYVLAFRVNICPITQKAVRHPVVDPTNKKTIYEYDAILRWVQEHHSSPVTRLPLSEEQIAVDEYLQKNIDKTLEHYNRALKN